MTAPSELKESDMHTELIARLPCPFCGKPPKVYPVRPDVEGNAFGQVRCENDKCPAQPCVNDDEGVADNRGPTAYKNIAIARWNKRAATALSDMGEPVAWRREWNGDESDLGMFVYVEDADDRDHDGLWEPLYSLPRDGK